MTRIRVVVTAEDITAAPKHYATGSDCPVAHAVHAAGFPNAHIEREQWRPNGMQVGEHYPLSKRVTRWTSRFDAGKPVEPFAFYLEGPDR